MGEMTSEVFAGRIEKQSLMELYGESADFFANVIRSKLNPKNGQYSLVDLGSFKGELLQNVLQKLPEYEINPVVVDVNEGALAENVASRRRIVAHAEKIPFADSSVDIVFVRYVLQWNDFEKQKEIIKEIGRVMKKFAVIQHLGADSDDPGVWRSRVDAALEEIPKVGKQGRFYSSRDELEEFMRKEGISFERVQDRVVQNLSDVYINRYGLDEFESQKVKAELGEKDYVVQTTWILDTKPQK